MGAAGGEGGGGADVSYDKSNLIHLRMERNKDEKARSY